MFFISPYKLGTHNFLSIKIHFLKYLKEKFENIHIEFEMIKKNSITIKQYNLLYQKNKLIETLIERLDLRISPYKISTKKN
ncbi:hypothetical protein [Blattabacterium sp. DPU]|uniref:hypothetical protein n=1 Tax=Blattabacterium sp. DPU TaxID=2715232 RepID=UPI001F623FF4|nr:hypothetical protein [Blattabacterium sp. DPU]